MARHTGQSDFFWLGAPMALVGFALVASDAELSGLQFAVLASFLAALAYVVLAKVERVTLHLDRVAKRATIYRQTVMIKSEETMPLSHLIAVRPEPCFMESGSKLYALKLLVKKDAEQQAVPLVRIASDWDAQGFSDQVNRWLSAPQHRSDMLDI